MDFKLLKRRKRGWMNLTVKKIKKETHDTVTLYLHDEEVGVEYSGRGFDYFAGQYLTFRFDHLSEKPVIRSYTLSSCPLEPEIIFTVKKVEDGFVSKYLVDDCKEGDVLKARGPIGRFCYDPDVDQGHVFMVAAGSGVTPFLSIMKQHEPTLGQAGSPKKMTLLVSYRTTNDLICWDTLTQLNKNPNVDVITTLTKEQKTDEGFLYGRINDQMLLSVAQDKHPHMTAFTCGPEAMMQNFKSHCLSHGMPEEQFKMESFES